MAHLMNPQNTKRGVEALKTTVSEKTLIGTTYETVTGGTILYTPPSGVSNVIYQFVSQVSYADAYQGKIKFKLLYGDSLESLTSIAVDDDNYIIRYGDDQTTDYYQLRHFEQVNLFYSIPAYTGSKYLVLQTECADTDSQYYINGSDTSLFDPFIIVYSV